MTKIFPSITAGLVVEDAPFEAGAGTRRPIGFERVFCEEMMGSEREEVEEIYADSSAESFEIAAACRAQPLAKTWSGSICEDICVVSGKREESLSAIVGFLHVPPTRMT